MFLIKRNGPNFKLLKAMKLNTGKSEPTLISPKLEGVRGFLTGDMKNRKE